MRFPRSWLALAPALALVWPAVAAAAVTAFRFNDFDLRDPHVFVSYLGCRDLTDTQLFGYSVNGEIQTSIQTDGDGDGLLDLSYLLVFDPVDPAATGGILLFRTGDCTAPMAGTSCDPDLLPVDILSYLNTASPGQCLTFLPGTVRPYSPAVTSTGAPCFATETTVFTFDLGGIPLTLRDTQVAATYVGSAPVTLVNGLVRGFVSEADANNTTIPASFPLVGGQPLSAILPGGSGCCTSFSDKDTGPGGMPGWWFYFQFSASAVPYPGVLAVGDRPTVDHVSAYPNPIRPSLSVQFAIPEARDVRVTVIDAQGREVAELMNGPLPAGRHLARWNGRDAGDAPARAGIYFVRVASAAGAVTRRVALLR